MYHFVEPWRESFQEIAEFLTGHQAEVADDRVLATVLFTDIVDSTRRAAEMGDRDWHALLDAHDAVVRSQLARFRGREVNTSGDGFLAMFDGPQRAIRCAMAIRDAVQALGIEVRAGLHTGECEVRGDDIGGIAVHIGARVSALAGPNDVLVSSTLRDLVIGSGLEFEERGAHAAQGRARRMAPLRRRLYVAVGCGETDFACRKRLCTRWHFEGNPTIETLVIRLFRDGVQFCSGLVDLVVCVGRHLGGGHRLTLAGERFVGLVAEDIAEVSDRGVDFGDPRCGEGVERETGDGGRRFVASEPVEKRARTARAVAIWWCCPSRGSCGSPE